LDQKSIEVLHLKRERDAGLSERDALSTKIRKEAEGWEREKAREKATHDATKEKLTLQIKELTDALSQEKLRVRDTLFLNPPSLKSSTVTAPAFSVSSGSLHPLLDEQKALYDKKIKALGAEVERLRKEKEQADAHLGDSLRDIRFLSIESQDNDSLRDQVENLVNELAKVNTEKSILSLKVVELKERERERRSTKKERGRSDKAEGRGGVGTGVKVKVNPSDSREQTTPAGTEIEEEDDELLILYRNAVSEIEEKKEKGVKVERELIDYCRSLEEHLKRKRKREAAFEGKTVSH
jgi:hypothetical protein